MKLVVGLVGDKRQKQYASAMRAHVHGGVNPVQSRIPVVVGDVVDVVEDCDKERSGTEDHELGHDFVKARHHQRVAVR